MYFEKAQQISYGKYIVTDITKRTNIIQDLLNNVDFYYDFVVQSGETPETVAYDHYNDPYKSWIVFMINEIYDPLFSWYMTYNEVLYYSKLKYGDPEFQETQYWLFEDIKYKTQPDITIDPNGLALAVSNLDVETKINDSHQTIKLVHREYINDVVAQYNGLIYNG